MPKLTIRAWRNTAELLEVREMLYPPQGIEGPDPEHVELQRQGIAIVLTWARRTRLPHAMISTAQLFDVLVRHQYPLEGNALPPHIAQTLYASTIARTVTGLCDLAQASATKRSMFEVARSIGVCDAWVEIRHDITHGRLPGLRLLELTAQEMVEWLHDEFWDKLGGVAENCAWKKWQMDGEEAKLVTLLKAYLAARLQAARADLTARVKTSAATHAGFGAVAAGAGAATAGSDAAMHRTVREVSRICGRHATMWELLTQVLIREKMMLPRSGEVQMNGAFKLWDPLLQALAARRSVFVKELMAVLLAPLEVDDPPRGIHESWRRRALAGWIEHLFHDKAWRGLAAGDVWDGLGDKVLQACVLHVGEASWPSSLVNRVLKRKAVRKVWGSIWYAADTENEVEEPEEEEEEEEEEADGADGMQVDTPAMKMKTVRQQAGWHAWEGAWVPRPIGVV
ncbi:Las1-domain-containing protein [Trichodelitschia bisporula]|uniref:Las1-domain-containing protein n=1 Tax=Trichodelitschia bisporula TaxID=703511 RepID=A0A6G1HLA3_9PEZI|nr:Las1-domain-containing protein [Trichodelitschia bisporula]